jgi:phytoene dehydrogenase-like protein
MSNRQFDAIVVGSGPNGLAAAVALARAGHSVRVFEANPTIGGGTRTAELTLPGFHHDVCSAIHPMAVASPFFNELPLAEHGLEWIHPPLPLAHPLDDGSAAFLTRSVDETAESLGADARAYRKLMAPLVRGSSHLFRELVGPFAIPRHPILAARFGWRGLRSGVGLAKKYFRTERAKALIAGLAGHSQLPLDMKPSAAVALMLGLAGHAVGWPLPRGGSQKISDALASILRQAGGEIEAGRRVASLDELPPSRVVLLDVTPRQVLALAGDRLPPRYRSSLERYRYGMGVFKIDWALSGPIPWQAEACRQAGTIHIGGTLEEIADSESRAWRGEVAERPFVLLAQPTLFDPTRAPAGKHIAWAYCHVPHASTIDMTDRIEAQIERFAPGFRDLILAKHTMNTSAMEASNANYIGGDINGGVQDLWQLFGRPVLSFNPYATPASGIYICSSSTPPGGGVHGLCGYFAAKAARQHIRRRDRRADAFFQR